MKKKISLFSVDLNKNASKDEKGANPKVLEKQIKDAERLLKES